MTISTPVGDGDGLAGVGLAFDGDGDAAREGDLRDAVGDGLPGGLGLAVGVELARYTAWSELPILPPCAVAVVVRAQPSAYAIPNSAAGAVASRKAAVASATRPLRPSFNRGLHR